MTEEQKGEYVGMILSYESKMKLVHEFVSDVSFFLDKIEDKLNAKEDTELRNVIVDFKYNIGKIKGFLK